MSRSDLLNSSKTMLASPNGASVVYDLGYSSQGTQRPRPKGLFYIRFRRPMLSGGQSWRNGHGFFAKSVDLPSVTPQVEELNQYGKKRIIHTGIKYNPISTTFYDTVDGNAFQMWAEYAKYYFGDFNHVSSSAWTDDITSYKLSDPSGQGFGFTTKGKSAAPMDSLNTQFFFEALEIYQVYGGYYTRTDIVNPKINSYEPDVLDYEDMSPIMIRMSMTYEAILYHNGGVAQSVASNPILSEVFAGSFSGEVYNPDLSAGNLANTYVPSRSGATTFAQSLLRDLTTGTSLQNAVLNNIQQTIASNTSNTGVLSQYGNFSFGNTFKQIVTQSGNEIVTSARDYNIGNALFSGSDNVSSALDSVLGSKIINKEKLALNDEALGLANTFSDGSVQIGKKSSKNTS